MIMKEILIKEVNLIYIYTDLNLTITLKIRIKLIAV